jgi:hypothetical protein
MTAKASYFLKALVLGTCALLAGTVSARAYFNIDPTANETQAAPGGTLTGTIRVKNDTKGRLRMTTTVRDWEYEAGSGAKKFMKPGQSHFSASDWLRISQKEFELAPEELREIPYTVSVPTGTSGEYVTAVLFTGSPSARDPIQPVGKDQKVSINVGLQIASLFLIQVEGTQNYEGKVTKLEVTSSEAGGPLQMKAAFRNTGNVRINAVGRLAIMDKSGHAVGWTKFQDIKTLPGQQWESTAEWSSLPAGAYHVVATFEIGPGKVLIQEKDIEIK